MNKLKIGIITNGKFVDKYTYELAEWLKSNNKLFEFNCFISISKDKKNLKINKILKKILFKFIIFFENLILKFTKKHSDHLSKFNIKNIVRKEIKVNKTKEKKYDIKDLQNVKSEKFDILIRSCSNVLNKDFLNLSKYGIISFHHGDYAKFRGSPAGFWEVFKKEKSTGFMIQTINQALDYGNILLEGFFQTKSFFLLNQAELYKKSNFYLKKILIDFSKNRKFLFLKKRKKGKVYETPKINNQVKYLFNTIKILTKKIFFKNYNFKLAKIEVNKIIDPIIVKNDKNKFLADPFLINHNDKIFCFAEEYDQIKKKGHIVFFDYSKKQSNKKIVLSENFHLSFPFIFKYKKDFFMCPETSDISEIRLYKSINFPFEWKYYKTIMKNINSADNIIFKHNNLWWLFTNIDRSNSGDFSNDFSIFYSKTNPLTNKWKSHPQNPILINSLFSRNAGMIIKKNKLIRISQVQGFDNYGEDINFNEIKLLNTKKYKEQLFKNKNYIKIKKRLNNPNIHHYSEINDNIIIDFKTN